MPFRPYQPPPPMVSKRKSQNRHIGGHNDSSSVTMSSESNTERFYDETDYSYNNAGRTRDNSLKSNPSLEISMSNSPSTTSSKSMKQAKEIGSTRRKPSRLKSEPEESMKNIPGPKQTFSRQSSSNSSPSSYCMIKKQGNSGGAWKSRQKMTTNSQQRRVYSQASSISGESSSQLSNKKGRNKKINSYYYRVNNDKNKSNHSSQQENRSQSSSPSKSMSKRKRGQINSQYHWDNIPQEQSAHSERTDASSFSTQPSSLYPINSPFFWENTQGVQLVTIAKTETSSTPVRLRNDITDEFSKSQYEKAHFAQKKYCSIKDDIYIAQHQNIQEAKSTDVMIEALHSQTAREQCSSPQHLQLQSPPSEQSTFLKVTERSQLRNCNSFGEQKHIHEFEEKKIQTSKATKREVGYSPENRILPSGSTNQTSLEKALCKSSASNVKSFNLASNEIAKQTSLQKALCDSASANINNVTASSNETAQQTSLQKALCESSGNSSSSSSAKMLRYEFERRKRRQERRRNRKPKSSSNPARRSMFVAPKTCLCETHKNNCGDVPKNTTLSDDSLHRNQIQQDPDTFATNNKKTLKSKRESVTDGCCVENQFGCVQFSVQTKSPEVDTHMHSSGILSGMSYDHNASEIPDIPATSVTDNIGKQPNSHYTNETTTPDAPKEEDKMWNNIHMKLRADLATLISSGFQPSSNNIVSIESHTHNDQNDYSDLALSDSEIEIAPVETSKAQIAPTDITETPRSNHESLLQQTVEEKTPWDDIIMETSSVSSNELEKKVEKEQETNFILDDYSASTIEPIGLQVLSPIHPIQSNFHHQQKRSHLDSPPKCNLGNYENQNQDGEADRCNAHSDNISDGNSGLCRHSSPGDKIITSQDTGFRHRSQASPNSDVNSGWKIECQKEDNSNYSDLLASNTNTGDSPNKLTLVKAKASKDTIENGSNDCPTDESSQFVVSVSSGKKHREHVEETQSVSSKDINSKITEKEENSGLSKSINAVADSFMENKNLNVPSEMQLVEIKCQKQPQIDHSKSRRPSVGDEGHHKQFIELAAENAMASVATKGGICTAMEAQKADDIRQLKYLRKPIDPPEAVKFVQLVAEDEVQRYDVRNKPTFAFQDTRSSANIIMDCTTASDEDSIESRISCGRLEDPPEELSAHPLYEPDEARQYCLGEDSISTSAEIDNYTEIELNRKMESDQDSIEDPPEFIASWPLVELDNTQENNLEMTPMSTLLDILNKANNRLDSTFHSDEKLQNDPPEIITSRTFSELFQTKRRNHDECPILSSPRSVGIDSVHETLNENVLLENNLQYNKKTHEPDNVVALPHHDENGLETIRPLIYNQIGDLFNDMASFDELGMAFRLADFLSELSSSQRDHFSTVLRIGMMKQQNDNGKYVPAKIVNIIKNVMGVNDDDAGEARTSQAQDDKMESANQHNLFFNLIEKCNEEEDEETQATTTTADRHSVATNLTEETQYSHAAVELLSNRLIIQSEQRSKYSKSIKDTPETSRNYDGELIDTFWENDTGRPDPPTEFRAYRKSSIRDPPEHVTEESLIDIDYDYSNNADEIMSQDKDISSLSRHIDVEAQNSLYDDTAKDSQSNALPPDDPLMTIKDALFDLKNGINHLCKEETNDSILSTLKSISAIVESEPLQSSKQLPTASIPEIESVKDNGGRNGHHEGKSRSQGPNNHKRCTRSKTRPTHCNEFQDHEEFIFPSNSIVSNSTNLAKATINHENDVKDSQHPDRAYIEKNSIEKDQQTGLTSLVNSPEVTEKNIKNMDEMDSFQALAKSFETSNAKQTEFLYDRKVPKTLDLYSLALSDNYFEKKYYGTNLAKALVAKESFFDKDLLLLCQSDLKKDEKNDAPVKTMSAVVNGSLDKQRKPQLSTHRSEIENKPTSPLPRNDNPQYSTVKINTDTLSNKCLQSSELQSGLPISDTVAVELAADFDIITDSHRSHVKSLDGSYQSRTEATDGMTNRPRHVKKEGLDNGEIWRNETTSKTMDSNTPKKSDSQSKSPTSNTTISYISDIAEAVQTQDHKLESSTSFYSDVTKMYQTSSQVHDGSLIVLKKILQNMKYDERKQYKSNDPILSTLETIIGKIESILPQSSELKSVTSTSDTTLAYFPEVEEEIEIQHCGPEEVDDNAEEIEKFELITSKNSLTTVRDSSREMKNWYNQLLRGERDSTLSILQTIAELLDNRKPCISEDEPIISSSSTISFSDMLVVEETPIPLRRSRKKQPLTYIAPNDRNQADLSRTKQPDFVNRLNSIDAAEKDLPAEKQSTAYSPKHYEDAKLEETSAKSKIENSSKRIHCKSHESIYNNNSIDNKYEASTMSQHEIGLSIHDCEFVDVKSFSRNKHLNKGPADNENQAATQFDYDFLSSIGISSPQPADIKQLLAQLQWLAAAVNNLPDMEKASPTPFLDNDVTQDKAISSPDESLIAMKDALNEMKHGLSHMYDEESNDPISLTFKAILDTINSKFLRPPKSNYLLNAIKTTGDGKNHAKDDFISSKRVGYSEKSIGKNDAIYEIDIFGGRQLQYSGDAKFFKSLKNPETQKNEDVTTEIGAESELLCIMSPETFSTSQGDDMIPMSSLEDSSTAKAELEANTVATTSRLSKPQSISENQFHYFPKRLILSTTDSKDSAQKKDNEVSEDEKKTTDKIVELEAMIQTLCEQLENSGCQVKTEISHCQDARQTLERKNIQLLHEKESSENSKLVQSVNILTRDIQILNEAQDDITSILEEIKSQATQENEIDLKNEAGITANQKECFTKKNCKTRKKRPSEKGTSEGRPEREAGYSCEMENIEDDKIEVIQQHKEARVERYENRTQTAEFIDFKKQNGAFVDSIALVEGMLISPEVMDNFIKLLRDHSDSPQIVRIFYEVDNLLDGLLSTHVDISGRTDNEVKLDQTENNTLRKDIETLTAKKMRMREVREGESKMNNNNKKNCKLEASTDKCRIVEQNETEYIEHSLEKQKASDADLDEVRYRYEVQQYVEVETGTMEHPGKSIAHIAGQDVTNRLIDNISEASRSSVITIDENLRIPKTLETNEEVAKEKTNYFLEDTKYISTLESVDESTSDGELKNTIETQAAEIEFLKLSLLNQFQKQTNDIDSLKQNFIISKPSTATLKYDDNINHKINKEKKLCSEEANTLLILHQDEMSRLLSILKTNERESVSDIDKIQDVKEIESEVGMTHSICTAKDQKKYKDDQGQEHETDIIAKQNKIDENIKKYNMNLVCGARNTNGALEAVRGTSGEPSIFNFHHYLDKESGSKEVGNDLNSELNIEPKDPDGEYYYSSVVCCDSEEHGVTNKSKDNDAQADYYIKKSNCMVESTNFIQKRDFCGGSDCSVDEADEPQEFETESKIECDEYEIQPDKICERNCNSSASQFGKLKEANISEEEECIEYYKSGESWPLDEAEVVPRAFFEEKKMDETPFDEPVSPTSELVQEHFADADLICTPSDGFGILPETLENFDEETLSRKRIQTANITGSSMTICELQSTSQTQEGDIEALNLRLLRKFQKQSAEIESLRKELVSARSSSRILKK